MNFKRIFFIFTILLAMLPFAQAQQKSAKDPVIVEDVHFKNLQKSDIRGIGGSILRVEVDLLAKAAVDPKSKWLRNVEVEVMLAYEDEKSGTGFVFLKSRAKLFALQLAKKTPVVFYVPWEAYQLYRLSGEPYAYQISLFVNGSEVKLTAENLKSRVSLKTIKSMKDLKEFSEKVADAQSLNEGVLRPLNECPTIFQTYEFDNAKNLAVPTYLNLK